jgi:molybdenum cofactor biosynthesis enzyme MoaA
MNNYQEKKLKKIENKYKTFLKRQMPSGLKNVLKRALVKRKKVPYTCGLFMTDRCNFKCLGCRRSISNINNSKEMKLNTVKQLLSLYSSIKSFTVAGFGEPTLCEEFVDIVQFLKKEEKKVNIITNGTNIDKILQLKYRPDRITISLYGYDAHSYLTYTRVDKYNHVIENFLRLNEDFNNVRLLYILTRKNYRDLEKILLLCDRLKPDFLQLINYLAYDIANKVEVQKIITVEDKKIIEYIDELCKSRDYIRIKPVYIDLENPKFNCRSYNSRINLDGNGNIGGCLRQKPPDSSYGNIFKEKDPFNSTEMKRLRRLQHTMAKTKKPPHEECNYCFGNWCSN